MKERILLSWSGGKDSAMALHQLSSSGRYEIAALVTTVTEEYDRVSMHGVRSDLVERQAASIGAPLRQVRIPKDATNEVYEARLGAALEVYARIGVGSIAFGDLFLEDIRAYRERAMGRIGMRPLFPIWKRDTAELAGEFIRLGFEGAIVCVDTRVLDASFAGRRIDANLLRNLPSGIDPCGENGEFHSFVFAGPVFREPIHFAFGQVTSRPPFAFCDLLPAS